MRFTVDYLATQKYLPTKRHRVLRERRVKNSVDVDILELDKSDFPIAFLIHDYRSVYPDAESYDDFDGSGYYRMFTEQIRTYNGLLFMPVRITHGAAISLNFEPVTYVKNALSDWGCYNLGGGDFTDSSIVRIDNSDKRIEQIMNRALDFIICDGVVWERCEEPMYNINTFGLGHNHGGTGFFISFYYNNNIPAKNYFNALQREEAIAYGKQVALGRGDTDSVDGMGEHDIIEVLIPDLVKRNPAKEHGDGDPFINNLESVISSTSSAMEAGLLVIASGLGRIK